MEASLAALSDFTKPFDVPLLDDVVTAAYNPKNPQRDAAHKVLMTLQELPEMWTRAGAILEQAQSPTSRFFGLSILQDTINTRWKILPEDQKEGIKGYVVTKVIALSSSDESLRAEKTYISKLNTVLIGILKHEWPHNWPAFVTDICGASKTSEPLCENNMHILRLLSEEVFDFSKESMTAAKVKTMKESLNAEFAQIFQLCQFVLSASQRPSLINATLGTLQRFLTWIPLGYIFETQLVATLLTRFFPQPHFRNAALECLTEIGSLSDLEPQYDELLRELYLSFLQELGRIIPPGTDLAEACEGGTESDCVFIQRLALFFAGFFKAHLKLLETPEHAVALFQGLSYLVHISSVSDNEIFQICLEYWHLLTQDLYMSETQLQAWGAPLSLGSAPQPRKMLFQQGGLLSQVRLVLISRMAKPEEVLIVEDENGEIVRELTKVSCASMLKGA